MIEKTNRTKWLHLRLTDDEYKLLLKQFNSTCTRKLSEYARLVFLGKPQLGSYRNRSMDDFVAEMIKLRTELNSIGNNFNQLVKKVNTYQDQRTITALLTSYELDRRAMLRHIETINQFIEKQTASW